MSLLKPKRTGISKKEKLLLLGLNILIIAINVVIQGVIGGFIAIPAYIVNGLVLAGTTIRLYMKGWNVPVIESKKKK